MSKTIHSPDITFSRWVAWKKKQVGSYPGIYLFGYFDGGSPTPLEASPLQVEVIYIGSTWRGLGGRLGKGHHKLPQYRKKYGDNQLDHLYVAFPDITKLFGLSDKLSPKQKARLVSLEHDLIAAYADAIGRPPFLNGKGLDDDEKAAKAEAAQHTKRVKQGWGAIARMVMRDGKKTAAAPKVLAAQKLMELAGSYDEAAAILNAVKCVTEEMKGK